MGKPKVAVVGAGVCGLTCAQKLQASGCDVKVFDKGRGAGGRLSTRRVPEVSATWDHGAPFFEVQSELFQQTVEAWRAANVVQEWTDGLFVGVPGMNAVTLHLAQGLDVAYSTQVASLQSSPQGPWELRNTQGESLGVFDKVVLTLPAPQALALVPSSPKLAHVCQNAHYKADWAVMLAFESSVETVSDVVRFPSGFPLSLAIRNSAKPQRPSLDAWVLHAADEWTKTHLEADAEWVSRELTQAFLETLEKKPQTVFQKAHRWRYARALGPFLAEGFTSSEDGSLLLAGDWLCGGNVEGAWLSGQAAAESILAQ